MIIRTFKAPAGSGKTYACAHHADWLARFGQKVLFVQPTKHLIDKTIADELQPLKPAYPVRAIHGDAPLSEGSVIAEIVAHFRNAAAGQGEILFITHAAFLLVPFIERKAEWVLIMDEVPQVDAFKELNLPETHDLITPHLVLVPGAAAYGRLISTEAARAAQEALLAQEDAR